MPSVAWKKSVLPTAVKPLSSEEEEPGRMSLTRTVPARLPSVRQSSEPWTPSSALKNKRLPMTVNQLG